MFGSPENTFYIENKYNITHEILTWKIEIRLQRMMSVKIIGLRAGTLAYCAVVNLI
jgi:hypothetical protein